MKFTECIEINPKISLKKGEIYPFVEMANVGSNSRIPLKIENIPFDSGVKFQAGDTIIARITPCLQNGKKFYCKNIEIGFGSTEFLVFRPKNNLLNNLYLYYFMETKFIKQSMINSMTGATGRQRVDNSVFNDIEINLPKIEIQNKIAEILSAYDDLIENNQKQIRILEEMAQRLYKEWFVDFRYPGYENSRFTKGIPDGWEKVSITDNDVFVLVKNPIKPFEGTKKYYATADIEGTHLVSDGEIITFRDRPSRACVEPLKNSVWFAKMSNTYKILNCFGKSSHLANDAIISSGFAGFASADDCFGFVYSTIASKEFNEAKNKIANGSTQVALTDTTLDSIKILLPKIDLIKKYSLIVKPYMLKMELLKCNIKNLQESRDRLLPKLMSGEIEIKG